MTRARHSKRLGRAGVDDAAGGAEGGRVGADEAAGESGERMVDGAAGSAGADAGRPVQAEHLDRARSAQTRVLIEDYAELIADLSADGAAVGPTALARHLGVSHASVIKCIARMGREGLVTSLPYRGVSLTATGHALAAQVRQRHRVVVALLRAVGVPEAEAEADAEGIEHHVSRSTLAAFERFLAGVAEGRV